MPGENASPRPVETSTTAVKIPAAWHSMLGRLAESAGVAVVLVRAGESEQLYAAQDNSLCRALRSNPATSGLCARDCGPRTVVDNEPRRCHAGLYVLSTPLGESGNENIISGRAFMSRSDYQNLSERFRSGDLSADFDPEVFGNIIWSTPRALAEAGAKIQRWSDTLRLEPENSLAPAPGREEQAQNPDPDSATTLEPDSIESLAENLTTELEFGAEKPETEERDNKNQESAEEQAPAANRQKAQPGGEGESLGNEFIAVYRQAVHTLAERHELEDVAFVWRNGDSFTLIYGLGVWSDSEGEIACNPRDPYLARAAESNGSMRLRKELGRWDFVAGIAKPNPVNPEAEIFPILSGGEVWAALLVARKGLTNELRRAIAEFGGNLPLPEQKLELPSALARKSTVDYVAEFAKMVRPDAGNDPYLPLLQYLAKILQANRASLMVYDEDTRELVLKAGLGLPFPLKPELRVGLNNGVAGRAILQGRPVVVGDKVPEGLPSTPPDRKYHSLPFICYPIVSAKGRLGVVNFTERSGGGDFPAQAMEVLEALQPQVKMALELAIWQEKALQFQLMSITDPLTGLVNRRYLMARLSEEISRSRRHKTPCSFIMLDLDDFKHYNDANGHQAGDEALTMLSQCLKNTLRAVDVAARYGGEEFSVLLPQTTLQEAAIIGERIRKRITQTMFPYGARQPAGKVTVSVGVADFAAQRTTPEAIIKAADEALYRAKEFGKNNVQVAEAEK